jgi:predicted TIM-barrel fold metal-dependent hydrolase|tara:strand:+ start:4569 stop:5507 length:939 start_codon:yes stop_codon:yes gene_type:complete
LDHVDDGGIMKIWDPHFHIWDVSQTTTSGHDPEQLFAPEGNPVYTLERYEKDMAIEGFELTGGAFVEAVSVCHVDDDGPSFEACCLAETSWTSKEMDGSDLEYRIVASASLESPNVENLLASLKQHQRVCGIRQIINHEPSWPRNQKRGNYLENPSWRSGFAKLEDFGMSFDLQLNPHQFHDASVLGESHPKIPLIIGHLGSPTLADLEEGQVYWDGMRRLADLEQTSIKLSMFSYLDPDWDGNPLVIETVLKVIDLFGSERCFFASNFPVEQHQGWSASKLYSAFLKMVEYLSEEEQQKLFSENARSAYRL